MTFKIPYAFGESGDLNSVPDTSTGTELSFQQGWSQAYELAQDQAGYRELDRAQHNFLWNVVTGNIKQWQEQAYPSWFADIDYPIGAKVRRNNKNYNKQTNNDGSGSEPGLSADWVVVNELQSQNDIVGGSIFKGSNGETVENGDVVEPGITHLRTLVGGKPTIVAMSPISSGTVTSLTETDAVIGGVTVFLVRRSQIKTVEDYGAAANEDSTEAFQRMADDLGYVNAGLGPYLIGELKTTRTTLFTAMFGRTEIHMLPGTNACVWLNHAKSKVGDGFHFNQMQTNRSGVRLDADGCSAYVTGENFGANAGSSTTVSLVDCFSGEGLKFTAYATDMQNTGNANESTPRIVSIQDNVVSYYSSYIGGKDVNVGLLSFTGNGQVDVIDTKGTSDNGLYHAGGNLSVGKIDYEGTNEPYVSRSPNDFDTFTCGEINVYGPASCIVNSDDGKGKASIGRVNAFPDNLGNYPRKLWRTRNGQVLSGEVSIESVRGTFEGVNWLETEDLNGEIEKLTIKDVDIKWLKKDSLSPNPTRWMYIQGVRQPNFDSWKIDIIDTDDTLISSDFFQLLLKDGIAKGSNYKNIDIYCYDSTGLISAPYQYRANRIDQENVDVSGVRWNTVGPYGREATYNNGVPDSINGTPTTGYWKSGTALQRVPPVVVGTAGNRKIQYAFSRQTTGDTNEVTESGITSGGTTELSDWRVEFHVTGT